MSEWKEIRLGDLCYRVCSGGTPKSTCSTYYEGGKIPWLNTKEINYNRLYTTESHITEEGLNNSSAKWIDANSVIVAMYGATAGRVAIAKVPMTTNQACCNLMIDSSKADYNFIYYYLSMSYKQLLNMANGAAQQNLNAQVIKDFVVSLPDIQEQRAIASFLSSLDDKIAVNKKICENLEAQAQALFKHWFVDFEPFKDGNFCANREQNETCFNSAEVQPKITGKACKFVESELGLIPEGWKVGTLGDIVELRKPSIKPQNNILYTHYSIPAFDNNKHPSFDEGSTIKSNKFGIHDGAVLLSKLNPSTKRIWYTGNVPENSVSSTEFLPFYSKNKEFTPFIYCYLNCDINYREIANGAKGTTNSHQRIDANSILTRGLAYSEEAIKKFCDCCQYLMELILEANQESSRLATLRDALLPKLMSGQIKVGHVK